MPLSFAKNGFSQAVNTADDMLVTDIGKHEASMLADVVKITKGAFAPQRLLWRSDYFGTGKIGAFHYGGTYKGKPAVLKIQGARPLISERWMIEQFARQNQSKIIRSPQIFDTISWSDEKGYEAIIMEWVTGKKVLSSKKLLKRDEIENFFKIYEEYKLKALTQAWLPKPPISSAIRFDKLRTVAAQVKPKSVLRRPQDLELVQRAENVLGKILDQTDLEFQHGHFSAEDLIIQGDQVVIFSNLFWKWTLPFADAVYAYHWIIYTLAEVEGITLEKIELQRKLWLEEILQLPQVKNDRQRILLNAALLERAVAGLLVDSLAYIGETNPVAEHMVSATRAEVKRLLIELQAN